MNQESEQYDAPLRALIETVINGEASADEHRQLERWLLEDEQARDAWLNYVNLHASLNGWFLASDAAELSESDIADRPLTVSREQMQKSTSRRTPAIWFGAIVVCLLVAGVFSWPAIRSWIETPPAQGPTIVQLAGEFQIQSADGQSFEAQDRSVLQPGQTITSRSDADRIKLRYADGTEMVLLGTASLAVDDSPRGGKLLHLSHGLLQAEGSGPGFAFI